jgi:hypothetical protein
MIRKIISGGQTGADRAALDAAIKLEIPHGGWVPKWRKAEDGVIPEKYQLQEMPTASYPKRTEKNVLYSDATLILTHGQLTGGSRLTSEYATQHSREWLHIDLGKTPSFKAVRQINDWLITQNIEILNVAGSSAGKDSKIYAKTFQILTAVYHLNLSNKLNPPHRQRAPVGIKLERSSGKHPKTVADAVARLIFLMPLKDKTTLANMTAEEKDALDESLGSYIRNRFDIWSENEKLLNSCRTVSRNPSLSAKAASAVIIKELWETLKKTHKLRVIK